MICNLCDKDKIKILKGKKLSGQSIFMDQSGRQWYGKTCPECRYQTTNVTRFSKRKCRKCNKKLTSDRYFSCVNCIPILESEDVNEVSYLVDNGLSPHRTFN